MRAVGEQYVEAGVGGWVQHSEQNLEGDQSRFCLSAWEGAEEQDDRCSVTYHGERAWKMRARVCSTEAMIGFLDGVEVAKYTQLCALPPSHPQDILQGKLNRRRSNRHC